jgi:hypothetical protein
MSIKVKVTGLNEAARDLGQTPESLRESARSAVDATVEHVRQQAISRASARYNLSEQTLSSFVVARKASVRADSASGSVQLQIKAIPLTAFDARVRMRAVTLREAFGRPTQAYRRQLPTVELALYRGQRARPLPGGFPLQQRTSGALRGGESVRRRVGTERDRLTGFRFYTFPKRVTDKLLPELQAEAGKELSMQLRVAYRKQFRGMHVLRLND